MTDVNLDSLFEDKTAQEQKESLESTLKDVWQKFKGKLDENNLQLVKIKLLEFYTSGDLDRACIFYGLLSKETKDFFRNDSDCIKWIKNLENRAGRNYAILTERIVPWVEECSDLFKLGRYLDARQVVDEQSFTDSKSRALLCSVGYDTMRFLCSSGRIEEATKLATLFGDFGFEVYLNMFKSDSAIIYPKQKLINNKKDD